MIITTEDILKLLLALALGGMIGVEREIRDKDAGFRTLMFICAGSTLFTIFSVRAAQGSGLAGDPARIAAQIVSGIGFLGAGVILRQNGEVRGLTTAATIWLVAALGIGVGLGQYLYTSLATTVILLALFVFPALERVMVTLTQTRTYRVRLPIDQEKYHQVAAMFKENGLTILSHRRARHGNDMICIWIVSGRPRNHEQLENDLFLDPKVKEFEA